MNNIPFNKWYITYLIKEC